LSVAVGAVGVGLVGLSIRWIHRRKGFAKGSRQLAVADDPEGCGTPVPPSALDGQEPDQPEAPREEGFHKQIAKYVSGKKGRSKPQRLSTTEDDDELSNLGLSQEHGGDLEKPMAIVDAMKEYEAME